MTPTETPERHILKERLHARIREKEHQATLEKQVKMLTKENNSIQDEYEELQGENRALKQVLADNIVTLSFLLKNIEDKASQGQPLSMHEHWLLKQKQFHSSLFFAQKTESRIQNVAPEAEQFNP